VDQPGRVTLSAKAFTDIVKELPSGSVSVRKKENDWVEIISKKSRFNIVSLPADEYPALPAFEEKEYFDASRPKLLDMVNKTAFAVSTDATRYHMNGVFLEQVDDGVVRMTATDGHRLSFTDQEIFVKAPGIKRGIIIPKKGLAELKNLLEEGGDTVRISFDRGYLYASLGKTFLFIRLIEGDFPDYKQVIPKSTDHVVKVRREDLMSALRRVSLLAHEKSRGVKLHLEKGQLLITSSNPDTGEAREELDVDYSGEDLDIGFNAKYLLDCLPVIDSEDLEFRFKDKMSPGVFRGTSQKDHTYIVMPMRL
jgi:DNA polymerase-3 subunit beta